MKLTHFLFFYFPLITNLLNIQSFIAKFVSADISQYMAYANMVLLLIGIVSLLMERREFTPIIKGWILFYILYYLFGIFANIALGTPIELLRTFVPVIFFFGFTFLFADPTRFKGASKIMALSFFTSCVLLIIFKFYNFSLDHDGVYEYTLERAGGVYGDANNAAVSAILSFVFLEFAIFPRNKLEKLLKLAAMLISVYAVFITFSKTGLLVLLIVLGLVYHKFFSIKKVLFALVFIPIVIYAAISWSRMTDDLSELQKERVEAVVSIMTLQTEEVGLSDRDVLFQNMMLFIYERPVLGNGVAFGEKIRGHNTLFGVWVDAGIITFLVFLMLLIAYYKKAITSFKKTRFFALSVLITLTIFMLTLQTIINQGYLMAVLALLGYLIYDNKNFLENSQSLKSLGQNTS